MKYKVQILPTAWEDLKRIEDWYTVQFGAETALKVSEHILDTYVLLETFPDSGSLPPDEWLNQQGYRMIICEKQVAKKSPGNGVFTPFLGILRLM